MQEAVFCEAFGAGAEKLNAALVALAALADRDDGDCAHQAQQRAFYALVALVRALERGVGDAVNDRLADPLPEIGRAHVCTPVTNAHLVCPLLLETKNKLKAILPTHDVRHTIYNP